MSFNFRTCLKVHRKQDIKTSKNVDSRSKFLQIFSDEIFIDYLSCEFIDFTAHVKLLPRGQLVTNPMFVILHRGIRMDDKVNILECCLIDIFIKSPNVFLIVSDISDNFLILAIPIFRGNDLQKNGISSNKRQRPVIKFLRENPICHLDLQEPSVNDIFPPQNFEVTLQPQLLSSKYKPLPHPSHPIL